MDLHAHLFFDLPCHSPQDHLLESLAKFQGVDANVWGKIYYFEKSEMVEKVYVRDPEVIIDDSPQQYNGRV